ncbi:MAG: phosphatase PAP2 family protein [Acidobacteriaceae bacterium]
MIELDARLSANLRIAEKPGTLRTLAVVLAHSGDSWFWLIGLAVLWWLGSGYWKTRALVLILSILVTAVVVFLVKFLVRRRRPEGEWGKIYRSTDPHSFPSGHAVRSLMLGVVMLGLGPLWMGLLLVAWAPLVGLARVAMGVHYLSDVVVGWVLGLLIGGVVLLLV